MANHRFLRGLRNILFQFYAVSVLLLNVGRASQRLSEVIVCESQI